MSRIGKKPIPIPDKTVISYEDKIVSVTGEKGKLERIIHPDIDLIIEDQAIHVTLKTGTGSKVRALQGLMRSLVSNMVKGVSQGFERVLEISGIGYRAEVSGNKIVLSLGYSHPVNVVLPEGVTATVEKNTILKLIGIDRELLGHTAASIRRLRPPEPYKGKGIKYAEEHIRRKAGKTGKTGKSGK